MINNQKENRNRLSIYIHWPFCVSKCPYCDFNSYSKKFQNISNETIALAYLKELEFYHKNTTGRAIDTIYFGGGTPSIMPLETLEKILNFIFNNWQISENCEITLEGNPDSLNKEKLKTYKRLGINRISIGVQSLNNENLKFLQRPHTSKKAIETIFDLQDIFNNRFSFDLIYTLPNQTLAQWEKELFEALKYKAKHMSLYQLTIEQGTAFYNYVQQGKFKSVDDEKSVEFFKLTNEIMSSEGIPAYEVSNYAVRGYESRHNTNYWKSGDWIGIGAGAHGRLTLNNDRYAIDNPDSPLDWMNLVNSNNTASTALNQQNILTPKEQVQEYILMGLRMYEGIDLQEFQDKFKSNLPDLLNLEKVNTLQNENLIYFDGKKLRIIPKKMTLLNSVIRFLIS